MQIKKISKNFHEKRNFISFLHPLEDFHLLFKKKIKIFVNTYKIRKKPFVVLFEA